LSWAVMQSSPHATVGRTNVMVWAIGSLPYVCDQRL
jgi:hypothetical protein